MAYIDRERLLARIRYLRQVASEPPMDSTDNVKWQLLNRFETEISHSPTVDVVEVKHGKWLNNIEKVSTPAGVTKDYSLGYKCSLCGRTEINKEPYCNCGAKMEGNYNEQT